MSSMSEPNREIIKPEMLKSYIWLQTADGSIQQVEQEVTMFSTLICRELHAGMGFSKNYPISLPPRVSPAMLSLILDYCRFHQVAGRSNKERKSFDEKFVRIGTNRLCGLASAAYSLEVKSLIDLTSRSLARMIEGSSPEEIREKFQFPDDLTEEEKLEPLKNMTDDPQIRLLNRLYARKRKELEQRKSKNVEVERELVDDRSLDDLLSFINGGNEDSKGVRTKSKKNRRRKERQKNAPSSSTPSSSNVKETHKDSKSSDVVNGLSRPNFFTTLRLQDIEDGRFEAGNEFDDDDDVADEIDPALKEIDREVEEFTRILSTDWDERIQEILSLGQERKSTPISINGNVSLKNNTSKDQDPK